MKFWISIFKSFFKYTWLTYFIINQKLAIYLICQIKLNNTLNLNHLFVVICHGYDENIWLVQSEIVFLLMFIHCPQPITIATTTTKLRAASRKIHRVAADTCKQRLRQYDCKYRISYYTSLLFYVYIGGIHIFRIYLI